MAEDYDNYADFYDNGPGSENMKRKVAQSMKSYQEQEWKKKCEENEKIIRRDKRQKAEIKRLKKKVKDLENNFVYDDQKE